MKSTDTPKTTTSSLHFDGKYDFHSEREWLENIEYDKLMYARRTLLESFMEEDEIEESLKLYEPTIRARARINVSFDEGLYGDVEEKCARYIKKIPNIFDFITSVSLGVIISLCIARIVEIFVNA